MKHISIIFALLILSTAALYAQQTEKNSKIMDNTVLKALKERRSVRSYKPQQITDEELKAVLEAGTFAPNGMGKQDSWIVAVQNPQILDQLRRMNAEILGSTSDPYYGAPTIVLVFGSDPKKWGNSIQDGSLVLGNMMNAAYAIGLGSCWINREMQMFSTEEGKALMRKLGIPEELFTPIFAIARISGWSAHRIEELMNGNRIIRPAYKSVQSQREYVRMADR